MHVSSGAIVSSDDARERDVEPPPGFEVMRAVQLDPLFGGYDRWAFRGRVGERTVIGSGLESRAAACREAWAAFEHAGPHRVRPNCRGASRA